MDYRKKIQGLSAFRKMLPIYWQFHPNEAIKFIAFTFVFFVISGFYLEGVVSIAAFSAAFGALTIITAILAPAFMNLIEITSPRVYSNRSYSSKYDEIRRYRISFMNDDDVKIITVFGKIEDTPLSLERENGIYFIKRYSVTGQSVKTYLPNAQQKCIEQNKELYLVINRYDIMIEDPCEEVVLRYNDFGFYTLWHDAKLNDQAKAFISLEK